MNARIEDLAANFRGHVCDRPRPRPNPGEVVQAFVDVHELSPNLAPGEYPFVAVFGAVVSVPDVLSAGSDFSAWTDTAPVRDGVMSPSEWDMADCRQNEVLAKPLTICVMNDALQLYIAVVVPDQAYPDTNVISSPSCSTVPAMTSSKRGTINGR